MKVIALKQGYHGRLREKDDQFDVPDGSKASWFTPAAVENGKQHEKAAKKANGGNDDGKQHEKADGLV